MASKEAQGPCVEPWLWLQGPSMEPWFWLQGMMRGMEKLDNGLHGCCTPARRGSQPPNSQIMEYGNSNLTTYLTERLLLLSLAKNLHSRV